MLGLLLESHITSVAQRLPVQASFERFKEGLLNHSVHRPPFSMGVFSARDAQAVLAWALEGYFRHYALYQYAFTSRHAQKPHRVSLPACLHMIHWLCTHTHTYTEAGSPL
jgi:Flagellar C1a complex subunit C1a-32